MSDSTEPRSYDVIRQDAAKVATMKEATDFLHLAECCEKELEVDLQNCRGAIVILKERIAELKSQDEKKQLAAALRRHNKPDTRAFDDL